MNSTRFPCLENEEFGVLAHVGFGLLAASYLVKRAIYMRLCLAFSSAVLAGWGTLSLPWSACITTLSWNSVFFAINIGYACHHAAGTDDE